MIRITAPYGKERIEKMSTRSEEFNQEQEVFWNAYVPYRIFPIEELASFFREKWRKETEKQIQSYFNEKWKSDGKDYSCEIYNPAERHEQPWTIGRENQRIWIGRSTSKSKEEFIKPGGEILFVYLVLEYQGLMRIKHPYELHYVGYFDRSNSIAVTNVGYPLMRFETWDELD